MLHIYVVHLSQNRLQILLNCLMRPTTVWGIGLCYHPLRERRRSKTGGRLRTSTGSARVRTSAVFRSRFPSSQAGLWVPSWSPSCSLTPNDTCFTAFLQTLVTYMFPGVWRSLILHQEYFVWPLPHQPLQAGGFERRAAIFHEHNYLCAQMIVHIIG